MLDNYNKNISKKKSCWEQTYTWLI